MNIQTKSSNEREVVGMSSWFKCFYVSGLQRTRFLNLMSRRKETDVSGDLQGAE